MGLGLTPDSGSLAVERISLSRLNPEFRRMLEFIKSKVLEQPTHDRYLKSLCGS